MTDDGAMASDGAMNRAEAVAAVRAAPLDPSPHAALGGSNSLDGVGT